MSGDGDGGGRTRRRPLDARRLIATVLAVLFGATLLGGLLVTWTEQAVFDRQNFADRAVRLLRDDDVRSVLADELTVAVIQNGPSQLAGFRAVIRPVVGELMTTDAFESAFRRAVEEAHRSLFTRNGNDLVIDLSSALGVLASSLQISNPEVAAEIPTGLDQLLVEVGHDIQTMQLWQAAEDADQLAIGLLTAAALLAVGTVALDRQPRRGVFKVGVAAVVAGALVVVVAVVTPRVVAASVGDPELHDAVRSGLTVFLGDLQVLGVWTLAYGVCAAGLATASVPRRGPVDVRVLWAVARDRVTRWQPSTPTGRIVRAVVIIGAGLVVIALRDLVVTLAVVFVGAYVAYVGVVELLGVVGRTPADRAAARAGGGLLHRTRERRVLGLAVVLALLVTAGGLVATGVMRSRVAEADELTCNGHAELCERRLDRVAFVGSHNSMSASTEAGWLFAEQTGGIAAQLQSGVRALLVKTHYGIPSGISPFGAPFVVTDRPAELAVHPAAVESALPAGVGPPPPSAASESVDPSRRDVYLCHVYCEYGATRLRTALDDVRRFLDRNPDEVVIMVIGDYVSADDTQRTFTEAGLFDRLYAYDASAPPPTLGELVEQHHNLVLLSEFSGTPPAWNNPGYGLFQDTPYTFTDVDDLVVAGAEGVDGTGGHSTVTGLPDVTEPPSTGLVDDTTVETEPGSTTGSTTVFGDDWTGDPSCAPNRGSPDSPLFQINHWVTPSGAAPTVDQARVVNSYDVLMARVRACTAERGRFPTIVGVNFVSTGDVIEVVDDLNGVD